MPSSPWPPDFERVPDEEWTHQPIDDLARGYDRLGGHGWYANLDPVVARVREATGPGDLVVDYSGGTGLLIDRLFGLRQGAAERSEQQAGQGTSDRTADGTADTTAGRATDTTTDETADGTADGIGVLNADASAKFLRLCLEKWGRDPRVALRLVRYVPEVRRLQALDEVLGLRLLGQIAAVVSANAVHLYQDLPETLAAWRRVLRPGGRVFVQSGNIRRVGMEGRWIIDETVHQIAREAERVVQEEARFAPYRAVLDDRARMETYEALRRRYFLPVRPLHHYLDAFDVAGLRVDRVEHRDVPVQVEEWTEFLSVYHEGILGWMGGSEKIEGRPPTDEAVAHRQEALAEAARRVFGKPRFTAEWTYIDATRVAGA